MKERLHLEFALKYQDSISTSNETSIFFDDLNKDELMFVVDNDFNRGYVINVLENMVNFDELELSELEAKMIETVLTQYNITSNEDLLHFVFKSIAASSQVSYFVWLYYKKRIPIKRYLIAFKGDLDGLNQTMKKFTIDNNDINNNFSTILKKEKLINKFKITKKDTIISFYRNYTLP